MKELMHNIVNKHRSFDRKGVGVVVLCYNRFWTKTKNAAITIDGWPDTTYFIENIKDDEFKQLASCRDNIDLAVAIESIISKRANTDKPVEWRFYAPK